MAEFAKAFGCKKGESMVREASLQKFGSQAQPEMRSNSEGNFDGDPPIQRGPRSKKWKTIPPASWKLFCDCLKKPVRT